MDRWLNQIIEGDCLEVMKELPDKCIDAVVTDPPFVFAGGISNGRSSEISDQFFLYWWKDVCKELNRILKPEGEGFMWCDWRSAHVLAQGFNFGQKYGWRMPQMIYHYREMPGQGTPFRNSVDMIAYLRGPKSKGGRIPNTTHNWISKYWYYGKHKHHPAEKDTDIAEQLIKWCSDEKQIILDPFLGSGTTAVAALNTGRFFVGIEKEPKYVEIARQRVEQAQGQQSLFGGVI
jgi:DNA modification methylase